MMKKAILSFGRMNPPTIGHEKLANKVRAIARELKGDPLIYLSHTQNDKKDPLAYNDKIKFAKKSFGKIVIRSKANTIVKVLQELEKNGYTDVVMVVGSDRLKSMDFMKDYNGKDYNFETMEIVSAGERDPDADGVEGMSASKMRSLAEEGNFKEFKQGLPKTLQSSAQAVFDAVRKGMNIK